MEEILLELSRLNNHIAENGKIRVLLRSLTDSFGFIALITDANNMDYELICALLMSKMERRKAHKKVTDHQTTTEALTATARVLITLALRLTLRNKISPK